MPEIVNIYSEDVMIEIRFRLKELVLIKQALDNAVINYSEKEEDGSKEAAKYLSKDFYKTIETALKESGHES